jgi:3-oxoacid CoA-transferase subunit B
MGGAMDLVAGVKRVVVLMEHTAKDEPKILTECNLPLTGKAVVNLIITDLGVLKVNPQNTPMLTLIEHAPDVTVDEIRAKTQAEFTVNLK